MAGFVAETAQITAADGATDDDFGRSVAVSGGTIAVGAPGATGFRGKVYVAVNSGGGWPAHPQAELTASSGAADDLLGESLAMAGNTIVAGAPSESFLGVPGKVYVFVQPTSGGWTNAHQTATLTASDGAGGDLLGASVALSNGTTAAGAPGAQAGPNPQQGKVYVFTEPASGWANGAQAAELVARDGAPNDQLGTSVAIAGATIAAGADEAQVGQNQGQGALYTFVEPATGWANAASSGKLTAADGSAQDALGFSAAAQGDTIVSGAIGFFQSSGAAYVFEATGPSTSLAVSPGSPNGRGGWYVSPVHVAASVRDDAQGIAETRCEVDPAGAPSSFAAVPPGCALAGAGATIAGDGFHTVFAAAADVAGTAGALATAAFKIDTTPPTVACQPTPTFLLGKPAFVTAAVTDATSGPAGSIVAGPANVASAGHKFIALTGFDNAGNATTVRCPYIVAPARLAAILAWTATHPATFSLFSVLAVKHVPSGATVTSKCRGRGCPFTRHTVHVPTFVLVCKRHHKHCRRKPAPPLADINLEPLFAGRHLAINDLLTFTVTKPSAVGEVWTLTVRANQAPRQTGPRCLAPGSSRPGKGC